MELSKKRRGPGNLALSFLLPFLGFLVLMIISQYAPFGTGSVLYSDGYHQYYPFFAAFRRTLRSGGSLFHTWSVGMGMDYLALISYYLSSPLYLLSVLVPESMLIGYYSLLIPVKLGFAGLFFGLFLQKTFRRDDWSVPMFAAFYALCAWALGYSWNIMWLDSFALLPLVALGTLRLLGERKFLLYTFSLFLAIYCNYYIGFFVCIFVALLFFCYEICCWRGFKRFILDLLRIALFSVLAIGMTAFLELPAYAALQSTHSSVNEFPKGLAFNIASKRTLLGFLDAMRQVAGAAVGGNEPTYKEGLPNLYCGILPLLLALTALTRKEVKLREKLCTVLLLLFFMVSFIVRQLDYIWHGFHFPNMIPYRFSFLFSFVLVTAGYRGLQYAEKLKLWQILFAFAAFLGLCACSKNRTDWVFWLYNLVLGLAYLAVLIALWVRKAPEGRSEAPGEPAVLLFSDPARPQIRVISSVLVALFALECTANLVRFGVNFGGGSVSNYPSGTSDTMAVLDYMKDKEADGTFYRAEFTHTQSLNDGALNGVNGISVFSSSVNENVTKFMAALGYAAKPSYNRYAFEEASPVSYLFLNLKYLISRNGEVLPDDYFLPMYQSGDVTLLENTTWLPLGFMTNSALADLDVEANDPGSFVFQNQLLSAATGLDAAAYTVLTEYDIVGENATVHQQPDSGYCTYSDVSAGGTVKVTLVATVPGYICLRINAPKRNSYTVYRNMERLTGDSISLPQMVAVGSCKKGDVITVEFTCKAGENGSIDLTAGVLDDTVYRQAAELLGQRPLRTTKVTDSVVEGTVDAGAGGLLYTSIPIDVNWHAEVDGQEAEITPVGGAMVALKLSAGSHTIRLTYRNAAFRAGAFLSLGCLVVTLGLGALFSPPRKKKKK